MARRAPETLADYVVVGIAPALIMLLVGSLVFFLIGVFYQGEFPYRLTWVMGLFVLATVCVARISMEEGAGYAALFGLPLGVVVGIAVVYFVEIKGPLAPFSVLINWSLLGLIWWCAHQLTWDCTLLDDRRDTTGQGLLQSMGWEASGGSESQHEIKPASSNATTDSTPASGDGNDAAKTEKLLWWQRWFGQRDQPAAHGRWVVYFSVAALPLFGLGQFFIPVGDVAGRRYAFWMLVIYVGSGLGLLLTTSFVGLRRYIRQRRLEMPVEMAATWLSVGVLMIVGLLVAAALLPRPTPEYSLAAALDERLGSFGSPDRSASRVSVGQEGAKPKPELDARSTSSGESQSETAGSGQGSTSPNASSSPNEGRTRQQASGTAGSDGSGSQKADSATQDGASPSGSTDPSNQGQSGAAQSSNQHREPESAGGGASDMGQGRAQSSEPNRTKRSTPNSNEGNAARNSSGQGNASTGENRANQNGESDSNSKSGETSQGNNSSGAASTNPGQSPPPRPPVLGRALASPGNLLQMFFYAAIAGLAAVLAWKYRQELAAAWRQFLKELSDLWSRLFGKTTTQPSTAELAQPRAAPKSFREFADPFVTGQVQAMTPAQLVQYSFDALQAWASDFAKPRENGQTPHEFSESLAAQQPAIDMPARQLAEIYSRIAYARQAPPTQTIAVLRTLWQTMNEIAQRPLSAGSADRPVGSA